MTVILEPEAGNAAPALAVTVGGRQPEIVEDQEGDGRDNQTRAVDDGT
jgi:hypothetical protein